MLHHIDHRIAVSIGSTELLAQNPARVRTSALLETERRP
jgi:hypothetical protein